ncbi:hypothetical protein [uncultured Lacinutrix sp.]|uniref:hypothetical protein n=1 Tax=uncultured Lacinutrix sp. TaxID=574032 RepID=UPI002633ED71|nr:hypothetical protein [uncultured Lacinutrix sp.]
MEFEKFEHILGKAISVVKKAIGKEFVNELFGSDFYYTYDFVSRDLYGTKYNSLTILTDEKDAIQSVTIHFQNIINRKFYESFVKEYGEPNIIQVIDKREIISESKLEDNNFSQHLTKSNITLREGSFEENPLFIIWRKETFQIKAFLRHKQNISEITFSISKD